MDHSSKIDALESRLARLERRNRQLTWLFAALVAGGIALGLGIGPVWADKDERSDSQKSIETTRLTLGGPEDCKIVLTADKFKGADGMTHRCMDIADGDGRLRARLSWIKLPPGGIARRPVTSWGLYNGKDNLIQELPID